MTHRVARVLAAIGVALTTGACGVQAQSSPEPLPPTFPVVLPPSVTQEPAPVATTPAPEVEPRVSSSVAPPR